MSTFIKNEKLIDVTTAFPFVKFSNANEYYEGNVEYTEQGLKPYLINVTSFEQFKDPFILIEDSSITRLNDFEVTLKVSKGDVTVSNDTLVAWF